MAFYMSSSLDYLGAAYSYSFIYFKVGALEHLWKYLFDIVRRNVTKQCLFYSN